MKIIVAGLLALSLSTAAFAQDVPIKVGDIEIVAPFSRATLPNSPTGGAYFSIVNTGTTDDVLQSGSTPAAADVQLHSMSIENDIMRMREMTDGIPVPAGETVVLEPSGTHIMLVRLTAALVQGDTVPLTLTFEHAGDVTVQLPVGSISQRQAP